MNCEAKVLINALKQSNDCLSKVINEPTTPELLKEHLLNRVAINEHMITICSKEREVQHA